MYFNLHPREGNRKQALEKGLLLKRLYGEFDMSSIKSFSETKK